ncbi:MAG: YceI family protein [Pseudomonadota bacterium]
MKSLLTAAGLAGALVLAPAAHAETWTADPSHTEVLVSWDHAGFSRQSLKFHAFEGALTFEPDNVEGASANFAIIADSVDSGVEMFDGHLKGETFLDVANHPQITFVSTGVVQTGDMTVEVTGEMTIKGVTNPATFEVTVHSLGEHPVGAFFDFYQGEWLGFTATATINRSDWGLAAMIPVGSDELEIVINTEMKASGSEG